MNKLLLIGGAAVGIGVIASIAKATRGTANIVAIEPFTVDKTNCQGACTVNGVVTWQNVGDAAEQFTPSLSVGGAVQVIGAVKMMQPGQTHTVAFSVPISVATSFCPVPGFQE